MSLLRHQPIAFVPIRNVDAARHFYEHVLGLAFDYDDSFAIVFRVGTDNMMLRLIRVGELTPQPFGIFGWESPDVVADVKALASRGVEFLCFPYLEQDAIGIWTAPNGNRVAWFKDPDGNTLSISNHD